MPLCSLHQLRPQGLTLGTALFVMMFGATLTLRAQQLDLTYLATTSSSVSSSLISPATETGAVPPKTVAYADLPDAPSSLLYQKDQKDIPPPSVVTTNPDAIAANGDQQTKRVLGIVPNFRSVSADVKLPPMSPKDKFIVAGKDTFDYSALFVAGIQAGFAMNSDSYPEFHQGLKGYGRYYWHTLADTTSENFFVGGAGPIVFKQDNRFYTLGHGGFRKRSFYAITRVLITRKDDGDPMFNFSEIIGSGASSGLSTLWYPKQYQTWTKVGQKWLTSDLIDGFNFWWKEWWPTANRYVFHTH
jgi:hypothetical protein